MDWAGVARRQEERSAEAQGAVLRANAAYGAGLAQLMLGDSDAARAWLDRAVSAYRESWADAPPESWGRPIAAMKARLLAGVPAEHEARWALEAYRPIGLSASSAPASSAQRASCSAGTPASSRAFIAAIGRPHDSGGASAQLSR